MTKNQRIVMLGLFSALLITIFAVPVTRPAAPDGFSALIFSSLLLMSASALLFEPFFARPTDVLAGSVSILLLLVPSRPALEPSWGGWYWGLLAYELALLVLATTALLLLNERRGPDSLQNRASYYMKAVATRIGPAKIQYFWLFLFSLLFFVEARTVPFVALAAYSAIVFAVEPQKLGISISRGARRRSLEVGVIFGVQGRNSFLVKLHPSADRPALKITDLLEFSYGMEEPRRVRRGLILERLFLDQAQWIRVLCHDELDRHSALIPTLKSHQRDAVYQVPDQNVGEFLGTLVGVVREGTEVGTMRFLQAGRGAAHEGDLVEVEAEGSRVLYQVVNAKVEVEPLESKNVADLVVGEAVQLGEWEQTRGTFERFGWVPNARMPVTKVKSLLAPEPNPMDIKLGLVPSTNLPVMLNPIEAVSHHTAILGVTGAGKSVFARRLVSDLMGKGVWVIVVDFTREWKRFMEAAKAEPLIDGTIAKDMFHHIGVLGEQAAMYKDKRDAETIEASTTALKAGFGTALKTFLEGEQRIAVFELPDVANTEGSLEYTQWFFRILFRLAREHKCYGRQVCVVLEEAHTVVPEWNFVGIAEKSAQALVNNIGQIALQGRKYGVGFVVIAQRTATVSKTVLTQCNTIVAFQCFDGTSIDFLSHYLPKPMADALPHLKFRHAIAVGKAVRSSVPLIFEVPEIHEEDNDLVQGEVVGTPP